MYSELRALQERFNNNSESNKIPCQSIPFMYLMNIFANVVPLSSDEVPSSDDNLWPEFLKPYQTDYQKREKYLSVAILIA
jgi:hypothetical protein